MATIIITTTRRRQPYLKLTTMLFRTFISMRTNYLVELFNKEVNADQPKSIDCFLMTKCFSWLEAILTTANASMNR